jgi:transposase-like protein
MSVLSKPYFHDEQAAFTFVEGLIWPRGPVCSHCGCMDKITTITPNPEKRIRFGLKRCGDCKGQFTVRMGTIFEESKLPMTKWLQAIYLMCASKKGVSSLQLSRVLEVTYKTAWFLSHRIREAMRSGELGPMGMGGATVEVDETFIGTDPDAPAPAKGKPRGVKQMMKVVSLVERETGRARSFVVEGYSLQEIVPIVEANLHREAHLRTDESGLYRKMGAYYASHETTNHSKGEYVRLADRTVHSNTVEGYFSIFKRGMKGNYQHCAKKHLHRYLAEFDFRYSYRIALGVDDVARTDQAILGVVGKRLTYRRPHLGSETGAQA